jgi:DNA-directed RNA polymerase subunit beta
MLISQANIQMDNSGKITAENVIARQEGDFPVMTQMLIMQMLLKSNCFNFGFFIPFLEHDANRALMGSNMMRQAVPLIRPEAPIVGTGLERQVASDSILINAEGDGVIEYVDANIYYQYDRSEEERMVSFDSDEKTYNLIKFRKTNQGTSINLNLS